MSLKTKKVVLVLTATLPPGVDKRDFRSFVVEELKAAPGGLHPDDPVFDLDRSSVNATILTRDLAILIEKTMNPILKRQMIAALKSNVITEGWFN